MGKPSAATQVPAVPMRCATIALALLVSGTAGCSSTNSPVPSPEPAPTSTTPSPTGSPEHEVVPPAEMVGTWETVGGDATLVYRFLTDGRYRFVAVLTQPAPEGFFELTRIELGTATVDGNGLVLRPTRATATRSHPGYPDENYTDRPEPLTPKRYSWRVDRGVLRLVDDTGLELTFDRQP